MKQRDSKHRWGTFGPMTYVAVGSDPSRPFRNSFLGCRILPSWVNMFETPPATPRPTPPQGKTRKMNGSLAAENKGSPGPATLCCAWSQQFCAVTSTSHAVCCRRYCTVAFKPPVFVNLFWWRLLATAQSPCVEKADCGNAKGKQIPSVWPWNSPRSLFALPGEGGERKKKKPHAPRDSINICSLPDSPTWSDQIRTTLFPLFKYLINDQ